MDVWTYNVQNFDAIAIPTVPLELRVSSTLMVIQGKAGKHDEWQLISFVSHWFVCVQLAMSLGIQSVSNAGLCMAVGDDDFLSVCINGHWITCVKAMHSGTIFQEYRTDISAAWMKLALCRMSESDRKSVV